MSQFLPSHNDRPDDPRIELADALERLGDRLYRCAEQVMRDTQHHAIWGGADAAMDRLEPVLAELEDRVGVL